MSKPDFYFIVAKNATISDSGPVLSPGSPICIWRVKSSPADPPLHFSLNLLYTHTMDTEYFLEFQVLAELESYGQAAEQLLMSESTLSRHIKSLETALNIRLFDRTSRKVRLNEYGKIFLPYARNFVTMQHQYSHELERVRRGKAAVFICSYYYIDDLLFKFHAIHGEILITSLNKENIKQYKWQDILRQADCELVFAINPVDNDSDFIILPFETDHFVAVLPSSHPLSSQKSIPLPELSRENFISFKENTNSDWQLKKLCRNSGFEPMVVFTTDTGSAIASCVRDGLGVSILLKKTLSKMNVSGVTLVELEPRASIDICICYLKTAALSNGAKMLLRFATEEWPNIKRDSC
jgi:DNA-binding transcriptional LysR family regulator